MSRLTLAARAAIRYNAGHGTTQTLQEDLKNGPHHVFGFHMKCRSYFCKRQNANEKNFVPVLEKSGIWQLILAAVNRIVVKADRLSSEETSNRAELLYMSLVAKYTSGKRLNLIQRDSFQRRCTVAGLQYQKGHMWPISPYKKFAGSSPGKYFKKTIAQKIQHKLNKAPKAKRKLNFGKKGKSLTDTGYGENAEDFVDENNLQIQCEDRLKTLSVSFI